MQETEKRHISDIINFNLERITVILNQLTRRCITCGSILGSMDIAFVIARTISLGSGSARTIISSGKT